jgi:hypothetical protein
LEFEVGKHVYIKVSPMKGVKRFDVGKHVLAWKLASENTAEAKGCWQCQGTTKGISVKRSM